MKEPVETTNILAFGLKSVRPSDDASDEVKQQWNRCVRGVTSSLRIWAPELKGSVPKNFWEQCGGMFKGL